jgi:hypothetical protein
MSRSDLEWEHVMERTALCQQSAWRDTPSGAIVLLITGVGNVRSETLRAFTASELQAILQRM